MNAEPRPVPSVTPTARAVAARGAGPPLAEQERLGIVEEADIVSASSRERSAQLRPKVDAVEACELVRDPRDAGRVVERPRNCESETADVVARDRRRGARDRRDDLRSRCGVRKRARALDPRPRARRRRRVPPSRAFLRCRARRRPRSSSPDERLDDLARPATDAADPVRPDRRRHDDRLRVRERVRRAATSRSRPPRRRRGSARGSARRSRPRRPPRSRAG